MRWMKTTTIVPITVRRNLNGKIKKIAILQSKKVKLEKGVVAIGTKLSFFDPPRFEVL